MRTANTKHSPERSLMAIIEDLSLYRGVLNGEWTPSMSVKALLALEPT